jgi:hypothetical protein
VTETQRILRLLGRRVAATGFYKADEPTGGDGQSACLSIHLADAHVVVFVDEESDGQAKMALSFLSKQGSLSSVHLNQWRRPDGRMSVPTLTTGLWHAFWEHEVENRALGRIQWMHGPDIPFLAEDVSVQLDFEFEEPLDAVLEANIVEVPEVAEAMSPPPPPQEPVVGPVRPQRPYLVDLSDIMDIFGD